MARHRSQRPGFARAGSPVFVLLVLGGCSSHRSGSAAASSTAAAGTDGPAYEARAVERWAHAVRLPEPNYPPELKRKEKCGHVDLRFIVDARGRVEPWSILVVAASDTGFSTAAVRAIEQGRYRPDCPSSRPKVEAPGRRRPNPPA